MDKTYSLDPEIIEKIKTGAKNSGLSESQFIAACIEFFFYKNNKEISFNPRDENTYKFAKSNKTVTVDGISLFEVYSDMNGSHKKYITETAFVNDINFMWEYSKDNYNTKQDYINSRIKIYLICCQDYKIKKSDLIIKDYNFSIAQKEMMKYLSQEEKEKLTDIILNHFKNKEKRYRLQQEIFDQGLHNVDSYLFADLCFAKDTEKEQEIMYEYYNGYEDFESEKDIDDLLNNDYLNLYPKLKFEIKENLITRIE